MAKECTGILPSFGKQNHSPMGGNLPDYGSEVPRVGDVEYTINQARVAISGSHGGFGIGGEHSEPRHRVDLQDKWLAGSVDPEVDAGIVPALAGTERSHGNVPQQSGETAHDSRWANLRPRQGRQVFRFPSYKTGFTQVDLDQWKHLEFFVSEERNANFSSVYIFFDERILPILANNHLHSLSQLARLMYHLQAKAVVLVTWLHYNRETQVSGTLGAATHNTEVRCRHAGTAHERLADDLVVHQSVPEWARAGVWNACHLEHGRNVSGAGFALDSDCQVEDEPRRAGLRIGWHEPSEGSEQFFVAFAQQRFVAMLLQCRNYWFDYRGGIRPGLWRLRTRLTEPIDYAFGLKIPNYGYLHERLL
ncbi:hypothetical protein MPLB_1490091 [Mesorhizobium sp. ORS 3324]|nr:hypothetical protein MPLB_1490091 [Mesorhizobium sp. ORS 3324]